MKNHWSGAPKKSLPLVLTAVVLVLLMVSGALASCAGDGSGSAHALNPLAVAGIAVGVLALMGVLLWLLLARRKRDSEDKGAGA